MLHFLFPALYLLLLSPANASTKNITHPLISDANALLSFKSKADLKSNKLFSYTLNGSGVCSWQGVTCMQGKVFKLILQDLNLGGTFPPNTLTDLDQLRVLSLRNNSLTGAIPDLSKLTNLKSLFLDYNSFTGSFPPSLPQLHRLRTLHLAHNNLTGPIPTLLTSLDRLYSFCVEFNRFNGTIPPLNQSSLLTFNVSYNNFSGAVPVTSALQRFNTTSFTSNPNLCGEIVHKVCHLATFFGPVAAPPPMAALHQSELHGVELEKPKGKWNHRKSTAVIVGFCFGGFVFFGLITCFVITVKRQNKSGFITQKKSTGTVVSDNGPTFESTAATQIDEQENELEQKVKKVQGLHQAGKSGSLVFCAGEAHLYSLDQLMRASAELLGRGSMGTTYKAVLDNRLIVSVKRLDAAKMADNSKEMFERHMESVGGLRHPNLVPLRAYFQAREERLLVYDYQPNGSLSSLIHGSKSTKSKPLHWTSCLKIAEDIAQGLSYIHQAWRLVHGNLKSSNVLLGPDFAACVADYCLSVLANSSNEDDPDATAYRAPETRNSNDHVTSKSDVYAYGIVLLELVTGKLPSQLPMLAPDDMLKWVRSSREGDESSEDSQVEMLLEVAIACSLTSPEQRPTMWQVLKMLQEIKESVTVEDGDLLEQQSGMSMS